MKCMECEERRATKEDPRRPPLEIGPCLCGDCWVPIVEELIAELHRDAEALVEDLENHATREKRRKRK